MTGVLLTTCDGVPDAPRGFARDLRVRRTVTGRPVPFEITEPTREALTAWAALRGRRADDWLFPSRSLHGDHITTRQYARLGDRWVRLVDLEPGVYARHSLWRTRGALGYKKIGNLRACQPLQGQAELPDQHEI